VGGSATWTNVVLLIGIARLIALVINGSFRGLHLQPDDPVPVVMGSGFFWTMFVLGIYIAWRDLGGSPTAIIAYGTLIILEARNALRLPCRHDHHKGVGQCWV